MQTILKWIARIEEASKRVNGETNGSFQRAVDGLPFMLRISDPELLLKFANKAWLDFRGRNLAEELGSGWVDGLHPEDRERCLNALHDAAKRHQAFHLEYRLRRGDGQYRWILHSGTPQLDAAGQLSGYISGSVDITEIKNAEQTLALGPHANGDEDRVRRLTPRELQVLGLIADGYSTKEISDALGIRFKTAESHRSKILEKLRVNNTAKLVRIAVRSGIVAA